ncbi:hypothetical protein F4054_02210 [Candidatus Poribacteria bacterium]|nr:hypothetical protein [Candidatus Poribacteria bacterium]MYG07956.1 hypothetical protein [Candidatus Poribacteria bacterium]MYK21056.1 hypothetical protein [Candidatus Poribacteria bacterium]
MENYKDTLAKLANQMNMKIATETATPDQNELKKEFGRIFQTNHCSLRLAERDLEIPRDIVRKRLIELDRSPAALYHKETKTFIPIEPIKMKDWLAITAYEVNGLADARRKTQKMGTQLLVF